MGTSKNAWEFIGLRRKFSYLKIGHLFLSMLAKKTGKKAFSFGFFDHADESVD